MNKERKHIITIVPAMVFLALLLTPLLIQFTHSFFSHEHKICSESKTHFHTLEAECEINAFHFQSFDYSFQPIQFEIIIKNSFKTPVLKDNLCTSTPFFNYTLRGPPSYSI